MRITTIHLASPPPCAHSRFTNTSSTPTTYAHQLTLCSTPLNSPTIRHTSPNQARGAKSYMIAHAHSIVDRIFSCSAMLHMVLYPKAHGNGIEKKRCYEPGRRRSYRQGIRSGTRKEAVTVHAPTHRGEGAPFLKNKKELHDARERGIAQNNVRIYRRSV